MRQKTEKDYRALAAERGLKWVGAMPETTKLKTEWECRHGHRWLTTYAHIGQGRGCPVCAQTRQPWKQLEPEGYHRLAEKRGFTWLGPELESNTPQTWWQCGQGHQWQATLNYIRARPNCPICSGQSTTTPGDYEALAAERGFKWLGPFVANIDKKTEWECSGTYGEKHRWQASYAMIRKGSGCPQCWRARVAERQRENIETLQHKLEEGTERGSLPDKNQIDFRKCKWISEQDCLLSHTSPVPI